MTSTARRRIPFFREILGAEDRAGCANFDSVDTFEELQYGDRKDQLTGRPGGSRTPNRWDPPFPESVKARLHPTRGRGPVEGPGDWRPMHQDPEHRPVSSAADWSQGVPACHKNETGDSTEEGASDRTRRSRIRRGEPGGGPQAASYPAGGARASTKPKTAGLVAAARHGPEEPVRAESTNRSASSAAPWERRRHARSAESRRLASSAQTRQSFPYRRSERWGGGGKFSFKTKGERSDRPSPLL